MGLIASLPMYNVTPQLAGDWCELLGELIERLPAIGSRKHLEIISAEEAALDAIWRSSDLLLSQTCGYPLMHGLASHVHIVGVPIFDVPGCDGHLYSSAIVVRRTDHAETLDRYRGKIAAFNDDHSHSGMNALRHAVAPHAIDGRFFGATLRTGSHRNSLQAVCDGRADIAAIDCVTFAFAHDHMPTLTKPLQILGFTRSAPGLPFIASRGLARDMLDELLPALNDVIRSRPALAARLRLKGVAALTANDYRAILDIKEEAVRAGYPTLA
jgi:ABC-type phosphate/phosphonate transport system substrate-binding protein